MREKMYIIREGELRELLHDSLKLMALENGGVDNWENYGISIHEFLAENGDVNGSFYDIVDNNCLCDYNILE